MKFFSTILYDVADGWIFYCKIPGCATNVTDIFCNDKQIPYQTPFAVCTGPPSRNTVCQLNGRSFVSTNANGNCEFEGKDGHIPTQKCTGSYCYFFTSNHCSVVLLQSFSIPKDEVDNSLKRQLSLIPRCHYVEALSWSTMFLLTCLLIYKFSFDGTGNH